MLGDLVELEFSAALSDRIEVGDRIGRIEGFTAISDLYAVAAGRFGGANPALSADITLLESEPYGAR